MKVASHAFHTNWMSIFPRTFPMKDAPQGFCAIRMSLLFFATFYFLTLCYNVKRKQRRNGLEQITYFISGTEAEVSSLDLWDG